MGGQKCPLDFVKRQKCLFSPFFGTGVSFSLVFLPKKVKRLHFQTALQRTPKKHRILEIEQGFLKDSKNCPYTVYPVRWNTLGGDNFGKLLFHLLGGDKKKFSLICSICCLFHLSDLGGDTFPQQTKINFSQMTSEPPQSFCKVERLNTAL